MKSPLLVKKANRGLIRAIDLTIALPIFIICLPAYFICAMAALVGRHSFYQYYQAVDALHRPLRLTNISNRTTSSLGLLIDVLRNEISFYGVEIISGSINGDDQSYRPAQPCAIKAGVFSVSALHRHTGLVDETDGLPREWSADNVALSQYFSVMAKSILAKMLYSAKGLKQPLRFSLFGFSIDNVSMDEAVAWVTDSTNHKKTEIGFFVNVNSINIGVHNRHFVDTVNSGHRVFADGSGVRLGAKHQHIQLRDNVNGTDLLPRLCAEACRLNLSIYFVGAAPGVAQSATDNLTAQYPKLNIAGSHHGYFDKEGAETTKLIEQINHSRADIVLIGLGSPVQEQWLCQHQHRFTASRALAVGGLFDFYSGRISRAPCWMRELGMEWVWRLIQEPLVKWRRYILGNPSYLFRLWFTSH